MRSLTITRANLTPEAQARGVMAQVASRIGGRLLRADSAENLEELLDSMLGDEDVEAELSALSLALTLLPVGEELGWGASPGALSGLQEAARLAAVCNALEPQAAQHDVLCLGPRAVYENDAPPWEIMQLVFAHARIPLALLALTEANHRGLPLPAWMEGHLAEVIVRGYRSRLVLMASAGVPVPEELVSAEQRLDLAALQEEMAGVYRAWDQSARRFASERASASSSR